ncbi:sporulation inhibitor of replication protein SirA [Alkalibacillus silvisoli]|uniref:Sporulation inhibitor of replication protein SirA n=1 Tax=Alkalibacillus silvisoli TaxID=392823 RepID=A0ABN0ZX68_9BACI
MYQYSLYFFKPIYAIHFYYKVDVIYRFLWQYHNGNNTDTSTLKQVNSVLEEFHIEDIHKHLSNPKFINDLDIRVENKELLIDSEKLNMKVVQNGFAVDIYTDSLIDADELFFQYIKEYHPYVFVVNFASRECGWILPLAKKANYHI